MHLLHGGESGSIGPENSAQREDSIRLKIVSLHASNRDRFND